MSLLTDWLQVAKKGRVSFQHPGVQYQSTREQLVEATLLRAEGSLSDTGALCINTGKFTGRSPKDKFIVKDAITGATSSRTRCSATPHGPTKGSWAIQFVPRIR